MFSNNPARISSTECPKGFAQCARMLKSIWLFQNFLRIILWTHQKQFSQPCRKTFARGPKVFGSFLKKNSPYTIFSTKYFPFKFSCGNVHFSFGNPAGSLLTELKKIRSKNENYEKYTVFSKKTSLKRSSGHVEYCFYNRKIFAHCPKMTKCFFPIKSSSNFSYRDVKCSSFTPAYKILPEARIFFRASSEKVYQTEIKVF